MERFTHLEDDVTQVLGITIERLQKLQRFTIQQKDLIALRENQFKCDFSERIAEYRQLVWRCTLIDG